VTKHLLALRWTNPNALVFLRDSPDTGEAHVEFELCETVSMRPFPVPRTQAPAMRARLAPQLDSSAGNGRRSGFTVAKADNAERVVAKLMFAARDLGLDEADVRAVLDGEDFTVAEPKETVVEPSVAAAAVAAEPVEPEEARS